MDKSEIERRFGPHPRSGNQGFLYASNHEMFTRMAEFVSALGDSREMSLALTALQESLMWVNAHIACNDIDVDDEEDDDAQVS